MRLRKGHSICQGLKWFIPQTLLSSSAHYSKNCIKKLQAQKPPWRALDSELSCLDKIKSTLLFHHLRSRDSQTKLKESSVSTREPNTAEILPWLNGGCERAQPTEVRLTAPKMRRGGDFRCNLWSEAVNTHPPLYRPAQLWNPQSHGHIHGTLTWERWVNPSKTPQSTPLRPHRHSPDCRDATDPEAV